MQLMSGYLQARTDQTEGKKQLACQHMTTHVLKDEIRNVDIVVAMELSCSVANNFLVLLTLHKLISIDSIAYIEFKTEAEAEKMLEEAQGADVQGRSIIVDFVGEKSQKGAKMSGKLPSKTCSRFKC